MWIFYCVQMLNQKWDLTESQILYSYLRHVLTAIVSLIFHGKVRYSNLLDSQNAKFTYSPLPSPTGGWNLHKAVCEHTELQSTTAVSLPSGKCEAFPTLWSFIYTSHFRAAMRELKTDWNGIHDWGKRVADFSTLAPLLMKPKPHTKEMDWSLDRSHSSRQPIRAT